MITKAVVLCGGLATRYLPYCKTIPKEMLPVIDRPLIQCIVEELCDAGIKEILIILGRGKECIVNHFDKNIELYDRLIATKKWNELESVQRLDRMAKISYIRQISPRGTGDAVARAESWVGGKPFLMCFGDEMFIGGKNVYKNLMEAYTNNGNLTLATMEVEDRLIPLYGIVAKSTTDEYYKISKFVEKPRIEDAPSNRAYAGPAVLDDRIFRYISMTPEINLEVSLADAYNLAIKEGALYGKVIEAEKLDLGNKLGFVKGNLLAALNRDDMRDEIISTMNEYITK